MSLSEKIYLGQNAADIDYGEKADRISRVNLSVDSDHIYTSGDDTGRTLEVSCPWGSQAMSDSILAKVSGIDYQPYEASDALLDQAAEIGDGITLGGVYSVLAQSSISLDKQCAANISAPYNDEIDDEYPYKTPGQRKTERKLAYARSLITKTAEEIRLEVSNELDSLSSSIDVKLGSITSTVQGLNGKISTLEQTDSEIRAEITDQVNDLSSSIDVKLGSITSTVQGLDGRVTTMEQTASGLTTSVQELNGQVSTIQQTASGLTTTVQGITGEINTIKQTIQGVVYESSLADGTTVINGGCIRTGMIDAQYLNLSGAITFDDLTAELQALVSDTGPDLPNYIRSTYIASTEIRSPTITGNEIRALGSFQVGTGSADNFTGTGYMGYAEGLGAGDTVTKGVAISNTATLASGEGNNYIIVTDGGIRDQVGLNHAYLTPDVYSLQVGDHELRLTNAGVLTLDGNSIGSAGEDVTVTPVWG